MGKYIKALEEEVAKRKIANTSYKAFPPNEKFTLNGEDIFSVLDYWKYAYSQMEAENSTIAEFLVARTLGIEKAENVNYWTAYDMAYRNKRIEIKATRYIHPWSDKISQVRTFSIEPSNNAYWGNGDSGVSSGKKLSRQSEVYVFCLNVNKNLKDENILNLDYWRFYVVPTYKINEYCKDNPNQKKISLNVVKKLAEHECLYPEIREYVDRAIDQSDSYYENL